MPDENEKIVKGFGCSCGFTTDNQITFMQHLRLQRKVDGNEAHQSIGTLNLLTGETLMPPSKDRTKDQIYETKYHRNRPQKGVVATATNVLTQAAQVRFVPRVFTCTLTPIMLLGYEVALYKWNWRADMPFENYLDTIIYNYFFEHGTKLQAAITVLDDDEHVDITSISGNGQKPELENIEQENEEAME